MNISGLRVRITIQKNETVVGYTSDREKERKKKNKKKQ